MLSAIERAVSTHLPVLIQVYFRHLSGQEVEVDLEKDVLTDIASGKQYPLKSIGEVWTY